MQATPPHHSGSSCNNADLRREVLNERRYGHGDERSADPPPRTWARVPSRARHAGHQVRAVNLHWSVRAEGIHYVGKNRAERARLKNSIASSREPSLPCPVLTAVMFRADAAFFFPAVVFRAGAAFFFPAVVLLADAAFFFTALRFFATSAPLAQE